MKPPYLHTPWGQPDTVEEIADGILNVSTPSHGGIVLSPERQEQLPAWAKLRNWTGSLRFWEEDCDWTVPFLAFPAEWRAYYERTHSPFTYEQHLADALRIAKEYQPVAYAAYQQSQKEQQPA